MDKGERTAQEDCDMLHKAHASCFLWKGAGNLVNDGRGEWQVSRVYSVLGYGAPALLHGQRSLDICLENGLGGFDLPFGYEAVARAYALLGEKEKAAEMKAKGLAACAAVENEGDRGYVTGELEGVGV